MSSKRAFDGEIRKICQDERSHINIPNDSTGTTIEHGYKLFKDDILARGQYMHPAIREILHLPGDAEAGCNMPYTGPETDFLNSPRNDQFDCFHLSSRLFLIFLIHFEWILCPVTINGCFFFRMLYSFASSAESDFDFWN